MYLPKCQGSSVHFSFLPTAKITIIRKSPPATRIWRTCKWGYMNKLLPAKDQASVQSAGTAPWLQAGPVFLLLGGLCLSPTGHQSRGAGPSGPLSALPVEGWHKASYNTCQENNCLAKNLPSDWFLRYIHIFKSCYAVTNLSIQNTLHLFPTVSLR